MGRRTGARQPVLLRPQEKRNKKDQRDHYSFVLHHIYFLKSCPALPSFSKHRLFNRLRSHELPLIAQRTFTRDQFKIFIETGKIIKPALITQLLDAEIILDQQPARMAYPDLDQEPGIRLTRPGFKKNRQRNSDLYWPLPRSPPAGSPAGNAAGCTRRSY